TLIPPPMTRLLTALLLGALLFPVASAQPATFDAETLDGLFSKSAKVEVNLNGSLLRLAALGSEDDPDTADMISALRSITVRVYDLEDALSGLDERLTAFGRQLESDGWQTLVRVRPSEDDTDDVWIYVRMSDDPGAAFDGMAVMSLDNDGGEASFVFIDGPIDPSQIGRLGGRFGGVDVDVEETEEEARAEIEEAREEMEAEIEEARAEAEAEIAEMEAELAEMEAERAEIEAERARTEAERSNPRD
ncbi:MAG TPA: DUF4252 domain-containing protein, partial [Rubricoccaceae bacterium]